MDSNTLRESKRSLVNYKRKQEQKEIMMMIQTDVKCSSKVLKVLLNVYLMLFIRYC